MRPAKKTAKKNGGKLKIKRNYGGEIVEGKGFPVRGRGEGGARLGGPTQAPRVGE